MLQIQYCTSGFFSGFLTRTFGVYDSSFTGVLTRARHILNMKLSGCLTRAYVLNRRRFIISGWFTRTLSCCQNDFFKGIRGAAYIRVF